MTNYDDVVYRWTQRGTGRTERQPLSARGGRMYSDWNDRIFSYGSHFEMGRFLPERNGQRAILLNGDSASVTTTRHQGHVRGAAERTGLPTVIIPYSAMASAGIDIDTVQIIDVTADRWEETEHVFYEMQPGWSWRNEPICEYVDLTEAELQAIVDKRNERAFNDWGERIGWVLEARARGDFMSYWERCLKDPPPARQTIDDIDPWCRRENRVVGHERRLYTTHSSYTRVKVEALEDGRTRYSWTSTRHWLGGSLIRAQVIVPKRRRCTRCDGTGRLPWDAGMTPAANSETCWTCRGTRRESYRGRQWAYFLSDFDHNETRPSYFFCELPRGPKPTTKEEALEALKPNTVRIAEEMGREVRRQGDIFAVSLDTIDKRQLRKAGAQFERMGQLLGTNHCATEVARMPNGQLLARGCLHHRPEWRRPDHKRVTLGKSWHVILKNTVPINK